MNERISLKILDLDEDLTRVREELKRRPMVPACPAYFSNQSTKRKTRLVLVHGMFGSAAVWRHIHSQLADIMPTTALDLTGHGLRKDELGVKPVSFIHYVNDILMEAKYGPCIILGHSLGGLAAIVAKMRKNVPEAGNIRAVITVSSSCPKGIDLPLMVRAKMLFNPRLHYIRAMLTKRRFRMIKRHAFQYLLNDPDPRESRRDSRIDEFEDESGLVLRELATGIPLSGIVNNVNMYALRNDRIATVEMQRKFAHRIGAHLSTIEGRCTDHMSLQSPTVVDRLLNDVPLIYKHVHEHQARY